MIVHPNPISPIRELGFFSILTSPVRNRCPVWRGCVQSIKQRIHFKMSGHEKKRIINAQPLPSTDGIPQALLSRGECLRLRLRQIGTFKSGLNNVVRKSTNTRLRYKVDEFVQQSRRVCLTKSTSLYHETGSMDDEVAFNPSTSHRSCRLYRGG